MSTPSPSPSASSPSSSSSPSVNHVSIAFSGLGPKLFSGGVSCMITSFVLNPFDVVKVRLQLHNQLAKKNVVSPPLVNVAPVTSTLVPPPSASLSSPSSSFSTSASSVNHSFRSTALHIYREEGYGRGLMKGVTPSMLREASYSSIRLGAYDAVKYFIAPANTSKDDFTLIQKLIAGMTSGAIGSLIASPTDLVKIRFQSYNPKSNPNPYKNTLHAFYTIGTQEGQTKGLHNLWQGATPSIVRAAILTGAQLSSYDHTKRYLMRLPYFGDNSTTHIIASIVSGLVTTTACNPADIIKTRIMTDSKAAGHKLYRNPLDCLYKTVKHEGLRALMKGWVPNYCRLGPHFLFSMPIAEYIRKSLGADTF